MKTTRPEPLLSLGFAAVDWIECYLVHGPGDVQGQPIDLDDEFAAFVVKAYRVGTRGERLVRRAFLSRPKGRNKSGLAAMLACFEALGPCRFDHWAAAGEVSPWGYEYEPGEPVGRPLTYVEILNVATEESQAGNTYDAIYYMLNPETCSRELLRDFGKIDVGLTRTNLPDRRGFIEPVTSADSSKDGGKSTFIVADETHLWVLPRLRRLHGIMTRNLLKRKIASGWMLETSTMYGQDEGSVAEGTHAYAKARKRDRTLLFDHRQASEKWDLTKRAERMKALREAYGPAAEWMNLAAICDSWDDPQVSEAEFRRYWLNQPVSTTVVEVDPDALDVAAWIARTDETSSAPLVKFAIESDLGRAWASIAAAGMRDDGDVHVEQERRRGIRWLLSTAVAMNAQVPGAVWVVDGRGPVRDIIPDLEDAGLRVLTASTDDVAQAYAWFTDALAGQAEHDLVHGPDGDLLQAVQDSRRRPCGEAGYTFGQRRSGGDICAVKSVGLAGWAVVANPKPPQVWSVAEMVAEIRQRNNPDQAAAMSAPTATAARPNFVPLR